MNRGNYFINCQYSKYYTYNIFSTRYRQHSVRILSFLGHDFFLEKYYNQEVPYNSSIQKLECDKNKTHDIVEINGNDIEVGKEISSTT